jgi:UDP-N-acetylmuramate--alanine ligase
MTTHFIGIGGAGMSGIARVMVARGEQVTGSDARDSRRLTALSALGVHTHVGHAAEHVHGVDQVVVSTAIPESNVEWQAAKAAGIPVLTRAQALAALMADYRAVAVAGTHGKTTTTSMLTIALQDCGADPSYVIGSELNESGSNAHLGTGDIFVAESDESDGSFLHLPVDVGIVTNVEADHMDYWADLDALEAGFDRFIANVREFSVICLDDPGAARLAERAQRSGANVWTYGVSEQATMRMVVSGADRFTIVRDGEECAQVALRVPGLHNMRNATAAFTAGVGLGFEADSLATGLNRFTGTRRRFELKGDAAGVRVYDDYAHHPTEVEATLRAARDVVGDGRLIVAFQAHRYTRAALFRREFGAALGLADEVVILEVFAAGETAIPGVSGSSIADAVTLDASHVHFEPSWSNVPSRLVALAQPGDLVMTMGAGDVGLLGPQVVALLQERA